MNFKSFAYLFLCLFCCTLVTSSNVFSQQKSKYNLLWEISGNGLKKPSYLFGSVHIKDKRVFNFSDSVMKAIESSSAFALESHPDSMIKAIFDRIAVKKQSLKSPLKNDYKKDDDMQTFIDAYLYGIARTYKKKIFGLEDAEGQMNLLFGDDEDDLLGEGAKAERKAMEEIIDIYIKGDINEIWTYLKDKDLEQMSLVERNLVMAKSITNLVKNETLFATVGVAHLPGEKGIIALLQRDGYQLRPVGATFTGGSAIPKIDYDKMDWHTHQNKVNNYSVDFPSVPVSQNIEGEKIAFFADMISNVMFTTSSIYIGPSQFESEDILLDTLVGKFVKDSTVLLSRQRVVKYGVPATEILIRNNTRFFRILLVLKNKTLYNLSVESEKNNLNGDFVARFFNSLKFNEAIAVNKGPWIDFKNVEGAFSVKMPVQPDPMRKEVPNSTHPNYPSYALNMYSAVDHSNMVTYILRYNDFPGGMYLSDKSVVFKAAIKDLEGKGKLIEEPKVIFKDGFEGRSFSLIMQGTFMEIQLFLRGNRTYLLLRQNMNGPDPLKEDAFFDSFKFDKYAFKKGITTTLGSISVNLPQNPVLIPEEKDTEASTSYLNNSKSYYAVNENSGSLYCIEQADISKYYRIRNLDSLNALFLKGLIAVEDSVYHAEDVKMGAVNAKQSRVYSKLSGNYKVFRVWTYNNRFYCGTLIGDKEELESSLWNDVFKNINYVADSKLSELAASKANLLVKNLRSTDTLTYKGALGALSFYEFTRDELPQIYSALRYKYADDTSSNGARVRLIRELAALHDSQTGNLLKELYKDKTNAELIRVHALSRVTDVDKNSYDWYLNSLLVSKPFSADLHWNLFQPLRDSVAFAVKNMDKLIALMEHKIYRPQILNVMSRMLTEEKKAGYIDMLKDVKDKVMRNAIVDVETELLKINTAESDEIDYGMVYDYLRLLPKLDLSDMTNKITNKILVADSIPYLHNSALVARITAGLSLDKHFLQAKLDDVESRYQIMEAFYNVGKIEDVPLMYRKHDEFAKLLMYNFLDEENGYPESIKLLGKLTEEGKAYYAFEFVYEGDEGVKNTYIGVVGAFDDQSDQLNFLDYKCHTNLDKKADDWMSQANALIKELNESE